MSDHFGTIGKLCASLALMFLTVTWPATSLAEAVCAEVKIEISQELTLERQAFDGFMRINNSLTDLSLDLVTVNISFVDELGLPVIASSDPNDTDASFFIAVDSLLNIDTVEGGTILPNTTAEIHWLIIPAAGAAAGKPDGKIYYVGAQLQYSFGGVQETVSVAPDFIRVKPLPELTLDYFLTQDVYGDDAFTPEIEPPEPYTLGVRIQNNGTGIAENVKIDSAQPKIVENEQGLLINFEIIGSFLNDQPAAPTLLIDFGNIDSGAASTGRWVMETTLSGEFTEFNASFTHSDALGGQLTSLLEAVNAHFLVHDVRVDALGRDNVRDFLAVDAGAYKVYESDNVDTAVTNQSSTASLVFNATSGGNTYYDLTIATTAGPVFATMADPFNGTKEVKEVVRSDGKRLPAENAWFSKKRLANPVDGWEYFFNIFDLNTSGVYTIVFTDKSADPQSPVMQYVPDRTTYETNRIQFIVIASDPNGTIPVLSAANLPEGASFIDQGNGIADFDWTPNMGQAGLYEINYIASDGALQTSRKAFITVNPVWDTDGDGMDDAWELEHFGNLDRDGTGDFDGDGISDLDEYLNGTSPVNGLVKLWEAPALVDTVATDATSPNVAIAADGSAIAVWAQSDGTLTSIWANDYATATGWSLTPTLLETDQAGNAHSPRITLDSSGNAMTVWLQSDGTRDNLWGNYYTNGIGWGTAALIESDDIGDANSAQVAMAPDGTAVAMWSQADGTLDGNGQVLANTVMSNRFVAASGWGTPARIDSSTSIHAFATQLAVDATGNVLALWSDTSDGVTYNLNTNQYLSGTGWQLSQILRAGALGDVDASPLVSARLSMNANGDAVAVWAEASSPASVWASVYPSGTSWSAATQLEVSLDTAIDPVVAMDSNGNAIAAFAQFDGSRYVIQANRYSAGLWGSAELIGTTSSSSLNSDATAPQIAVDASGNAMVVWQQFDGVQYNVWANRFDAAGGAWESPLVIETENTGNAEAVQIAMNGAGEAVTVWQQADDSSVNIQSNTYENDNTGLPNIAPIAFAATDLVTDEQITVTLDGSTAFDQDGTIDNYVWTQLSGTPVTLDTATTATSGIATFVAPTLTSSETLAFQLTVIDDSAATSTANTTVTVNPVNANPIADAGVDQSIDEQIAVTLSGTASADSDGSIASYAWSQTSGTAVTLTGASTVTAGFTAPVVLATAGSQVLTFQLSVTDNEGAIAIDTMTVTVNPVNGAPTASAGLDQNVNEQSAVTLSGSGTDSDGSIASYAWSQTGGLAVTLIGANTAIANFTSPVVLIADGPQILTFLLSVTDNEGGVTTDAIIITVNAVNADPVSDAGVDQSVDEQTAVSLTGSGTDSDGTVASYAWTQTGGTAVTLTGAATANASFTAPIVLAPVSPETLTFDLSVTDNEGGVITDSIVVTVNAVNANPTADAGIDQSVDEQTGVLLTGSGSDSDGTIATYAWSQTGGVAVTLTSATTANASFTAPVVLALVSPETLTFDLSVTDNEGSTTNDTIIVTVNAVNANPVSVAGIDQSVDEQSAVSLTGSGTDSDGTVASYAWTQTGGTVVTLTGAATANASFTAPTVLAPVSPETLTFDLSVTDNEGGITTDSITITVNAVNTNPTANAGIDQSVDEQTAVALTGSGSDADGTVASYAWSQTGGSAVTLTGATTANASFTAPIVLAPVSPETLTFDLSVTDNEGGVTTDSIIVTVNAVNTNPTANAGIDQSVDEQTLVSLAGSGTDADGTVASYAWTQTGGSAVTLSGAATANANFTAPIVLAPVSPELLTFDLTVTDNEGGVTTDTIVVTVNAVNVNPTSNAGVDQSVDEQTTVALTGSGTDSDGTVASYSWTQTGGTAVTLTGAATASASFTAPIVLAPVSPEMLTFDLTVTDNEGGVTTDTIIVTVNAMNAKPTANAGIDQTVEEQAAVALVGIGSDADGSVASYAWSQTGGTAVTLTGENTANASFTAPIVLVTDGPQMLTFDLTVTDNEGGVVTDAIIITVNAVNAAPTANAGIDQTVEEQAAVALVGIGSDPDGTVASYSWVQTGGSAVTLTGAATANASFTSPIVLAPVSPELLTFDLTVTDNEGGITTDSIVITVNAVNTKPTANAGIDQSVDEETAVTLIGSGTDSDGTVASYAWTQTGGSAVTLTGAATANASFTAPIVLAPVSPDTLTFDLSVTDNEGGVTTDTIIVTVNAVNANPTANAGIDQSANEQTAVSLIGSGTDADGTVASYAWTQTGGTVVTLTGAATANASFTSPIVLAPVSPETLTFDLTVTDNEGGITTDSIIVTVNAVNAAPTVNAGTDQMVAEGTLVNLAAIASDSDGSISSYSWTQLSGPTVTLTGALTANAEFTSLLVYEDAFIAFQITVTDNEGSQATDSVTIGIFSTNPDDDGDGMDDSWEVLYFGDLNRDGTGDFDGDGFTDLVEFQQGSNPLVFTAPLAPGPTALNAIAVDAGVTLTWDPVVDASGYNLYWSNSPGVTPSTGQLIADVSSNYLHAGLTSGSNYYYVVTALVSGSESAASSEVSAIADIRAWKVPEEIWTSGDMVYDDLGVFRAKNRTYIKINSSGKAIATWVTYDYPEPTVNNYLVWVNQYDPATGWGIPEQLITRNNLQNHSRSRVVMNDNGQAMIFFTFVDNDNTQHLQTIYYDSTSGWGIPETVISHQITDINNIPWFWGEKHDRISGDMDDSGNVVLFWVLPTSAANSANKIWANRFVKGVGWGVAEIINTTTKDAKFPEFAMNKSTGSGIAVWAEITANAYRLFSANFDATSGWGAPERIENFSGDVDLPSIDMDQNGNAIVVWEQTDGSNEYIASNRYDVIAGWGVAESIDSSALGATYFIPKVKMNNNGQAIAVWHELDGTVASIWANRYVDGSWGADTVIESFDDVYSDVQPELVINSEGDATVVWQRYLNKINSIGDPGYSASIWGNRFDASVGSWGKPRSIETFDPDFMMADPNIVIDGSGNVISLWSGVTGWLGVSPTPQRSVIATRHSLVSNAPVANAGSDQTNFSGNTVLLDGASSYSPDMSGISAYNWELISNIEVVLTGGDTASPTFTAPTVITETTLEFQLTVTSGDVTDADTVVVTLVP